MFKKFLLKKSDCSGCYACKASCPQKCISMQQDDEGFWYPFVDESKCVSCDICEKVCPVINKNTEQNASCKAFAMIANDDKVRETSSSGGIFSLLANKIIANGGIVFCAAFTKDFKGVVHIACKSEQDLLLLRGSKYVQSKIGNTYQEAKKYLKEGVQVFFTGTPCQIAGLKAYLGKDYKNLITQDIICHGVPSPFVWKKYVEYREEKAKIKTQNISFRNKKSGWRVYSVQFKFINSAEQIQKFSKDLYMRGFIDNLYLRPSCYNCAFKSKNRIADITLADFWGVEKVCPQMDDNKGTSLVLVNTDKGQALIDEIDKEVKKCVVDKVQALKYNSAATRSVSMNSKRAMFMQDLQKYPLERVLKKYCKESRISTIKKFTINTLSAIKKIIIH